MLPREMRRKQSQLSFGNTGYAATRRFYGKSPLLKLIYVFNPMVCDKRTAVLG